MKTKDIVIIGALITIIIVIGLYIYFKTPLISPDIKYDIEKAHDDAIKKAGEKPDYTQEYESYFDNNIYPSTFEL